MSHQFLLKRLTRFPKATPRDELRFTAGVNVMVGDRDAGKSTWLRLFDFLLGNDASPVEILGKEVAGAYDTIEAELELAGQSVILRRSWTPTAPRAKVMWNDEPVALADLSDRLLTALNIPRLHYPKGDPFTERAWPALSFRTLLRHMYRQERLWSDIADKQWDADIHACLALFLGVAETLFPPKFGELVNKQKKLTALQAKREAHQILLNQIASELLRQREITTAVTKDSLDAAEANLDQENAELSARRDALLAQIEAKAEADFDALTRATRDRLEKLRVTAAEIQREEVKIRERLEQLLPYAQMLKDELGRFSRAEAASELLANLRVTHCPVCDREVTPTNHGRSCYLCHRPHEAPSLAAGKKRVQFEHLQLEEEREEVQEMLDKFNAELELLQLRRKELNEMERELEMHLRPARQLAASMLPPDLTLLDQECGRIAERKTTLQRLRESLATQHELIAEIDSLGREEAALKAELTAIKGEADLTSVSRALEDGMNDYFNLIRQGDPSRWQHGNVKFKLNQRTFSFDKGGKLGATSQALFLFAYHYGLLSLSADPRFCYPGFVIIDFPVNLADGKEIRDKENYLVEPFVRLCAKPKMHGTQFIAAGHAFDRLDALHISIQRPAPGE